MKAPEDKRIVVISDCHGDADGFRDLLEKTEAILADDSKNPEVWICQIGDLIDGSNYTLDGDYECLLLSKEFVDCQIVGNHDLPLIYGPRSWGPKFSSIFPPAFRTQDLLEELAEQNHYIAAASYKDALITHAGFDPGWTDMTDFDISDSAETLANKLNERFAARSDGGSYDPVLEAISRIRGGREPFGGIIWSHLEEMIMGYKEYPEFQLEQIVGHSPVSEAPDRRGHVIGIDCRGAIVAIYRDPEDSEWKSFQVSLGNPQKSPK